MTDRDGVSSKCLVLSLGEEEASRAKLGCKRYSDYQARSNNHIARRLAAVTPPLGPVVEMLQRLEAWRLVVWAFHPAGFSQLAGPGRTVSIAIINSCEQAIAAPCYPLRRLTYRAA